MSLHSTLPVALALAFAVSTLTCRWLVSRPHAALLDRPNARSLHRTPTPRSGGLGLLAGLLAAALAWALTAPMPPALVWMAVALLVVAGVSLWDDFGHVSRRLRFAAHGVAGVLLLAGGLSWDGLDLPGVSSPFPRPLAIVLTLGFVVWMVNLFNFMDGMDGFAGGMAVIGFLALTLLGWRAGDPQFALAAGLVATAAGGFLVFNFPPARIFLGDVGSSSLGLLAAALSLWGAQRALFPLWVAGLAFSPFIVDATWTLLRRLANGERIWEAHRSHHYQRLVLAGWGHRKTVLRAYLLMVAAGACAVAAPRLSHADQWFLLGAWAALYLLIHYRVRLVERQAAAPPQ
jgi:UDP-N-acetylmuramyl pentapeptide phosphotransferase/UDP-N-acetylglucosamine-1-phosphate transferase